MAKSIRAKCNWVLGEISPRMMGRFEIDKPIFHNASEILENILILQSGGIMFRPGTVFAAEIKDSGEKVRLERFRYSTSQEYAMEVGAKYIRFFANKGQLTSGGVPVEVSTIFEKADLFGLQFANKADVMYIVHPNYFPQKLVRTSSTTFTISDAPIVRGAFLDSNIIASSTITPSADTGAGITLTAVNDIFLAGHVGSLWRIKDGVVKIVGFTSTKIVTADVQAEPDGSAGNLNAAGATSDWAEGAFSAVRGYPAAVTFHDGRLLYGGTSYAPQKWYGSVIGAYDNFDVGAGNDSDAYIYEISSNLVNDIRWMEADTYLKFGTSGGTISAKNSSAVGITPKSVPQIVFDSDYSCMYQQPERIGGYLFYLQSNTFQMRQLVYDFYTDRDKSEDMNMLADHVLRDGGGAVEMMRQQSPSDRLWVVRNDGQIAVFSRNPDQQVQGWTRIVAGETSGGVGVFETACVLPQDGDDDLIWVVVKRLVNGVIKRYVEYFSTEIFNNYWEANRLDCSLSLDSPIIITGITQASPGVITAVGHGLVDGDQIKIDNVVGMTELNNKRYYVKYIDVDTFSLLSIDDSSDIDTTNYGDYFSDGEVRKMNTVFSGLDHLEGETVYAVADGGIPPGQQSFVVSGGSITLPYPAAVVHIGLLYTGRIKFLPLGDTATNTTGQGKSRKLYEAIFRVWQSAGGKFGMNEDHLFNMIYPNQTPNVNPPATGILYTGDFEPDFESYFTKYCNPIIVLDKPLPFMLLAAIMSSDVEDSK